MSVVLDAREPSARYLEDLQPPLAQNLDLVAKGDGGVERLRALILTLAVKGRLVPQDPRDVPAVQLVERIHEEKAKLGALPSGRRDERRGVSIGTDDLSRLPCGWIWTTLGEIGLISPRVAADDDVIVSFVPMSAIPIAFMETHTFEPRPWGGIRSGFTHFAEGDVGVAKITPCFENGKSTVFSGLCGGIGAGTTELHVVRPLGGIEPRYILAFLKSPSFLRAGELVMTGSAGQKRLPRAYFETRPFPLPPLAEQVRIIARVEELMRLCDALEAKGRLEAEQHDRLLRALLDTLTDSASPEELAANWQRVAEHFDLLLDRPEAVDVLEQTVLRLAVRGLLVPQDPNDAPARDVLELACQEKRKLMADGNASHERPLPALAPEEQAFAIPAGWTWATLGELVLKSEAGWSPTCLAAPCRPGKWGVLKVSAVSWGKFDPNANKELPDGLDPRPELEVRKGDFLLSRANTAELVARSVLVEDTPDRLMLSDKIIRLEISQHVCRQFLNLSNNADHTRAYYTAKASGTSSSMKNVPREVVLASPVALPPAKEQRRIVARVAELRRLCADLRRRLEESQATQSRLADALVESALV